MRIDAPVGPASTLDEEALELARLALVLPAVIVIPIASGVEVEASILRVPGAAIRRYRQARVQRAENRQPGARAARGRAGERIRGLPGRRGPARPGRDHRRQAGSLEARRRAPPFRLPDRRPLRQPQMRLRRPVARHRALDGAERRRDPALSRPGGPRQRPRQQDPRLQAAGAGLRHLRRRRDARLRPRPAPLRFRRRHADGARRRRACGS